MNLERRKELSVLAARAKAVKSELAALRAEAEEFAKVEKAYLEELDDLNSVGGKGQDARNAVSKLSAVKLLLNNVLDARLENVAYFLEAAKG